MLIPVEEGVNSVSDASNKSLCMLVPEERVWPMCVSSSRRGRGICGNKKRRCIASVCVKKAVYVSLFLVNKKN